MSNRLLPPFMGFFDGSGDPLSGGKLEWFESGTSNNLDTYSDAALTSANANPIILNSAGRPDSGGTDIDVFGKDQDYKLTVSDSDDVQIATFDPIRGVVRAKGSDITSAATLVIGLDGDYFDVAGSTGPITAMTVAAGTLFVLQFDSTPTLTDGASIDLGGANITVAAGDRGIFYATAANTVQMLSFQREGVEPLGSGRVIQAVHTADGALATTTTVMPFDDTIPQNDEGGEFMTLAITPKNTTNRLVIDALVNIACSVTTEQLTAALFQDSTADALAAVDSFQGTANGMMAVFLRHEMAAGTTSSTTFKIRAGVPSAATTTFNGEGAARKFGGVLLSSIRITEYAP